MESHASSHFLNIRILPFLQTFSSTREVAEFVQLVGNTKMASQQIEIQFFQFSCICIWDASLADTPAEGRSISYDAISICGSDCHMSPEFFCFCFVFRHLFGLAVLYLNLQCACNEWLCHAIWRIEQLEKEIARHVGATATATWTHELCKHWQNADMPSLFLWQFFQQFFLFFSQRTNKQIVCYYRWVALATRSRQEYLRIRSKSRSRSRTRSLSRESD